MCVYDDLYYDATTGEGERPASSKQPAHVRRKHRGHHLQRGLTLTLSTHEACTYLTMGSPSLGIVTLLLDAVYHGDEVARMMRNRFRFQTSRFRGA